MKKTFRFVLCTLMAVCMAVSFTACGDDNDDPKDPSEPGVVDELGELKSVEATFTLSLTGDYDQLFSTKTVSYTDFDGAVKTEKMTGNTITITRKLDNITKQTNAKLSFDLLLQDNDNAGETKTYNFGHKVTLKVVANYEKKSGVVKFDNIATAKLNTMDYDLVAGGNELREVLRQGLEAEIGAVVSVDGGTIEASTLN